MAIDDQGEEDARDIVYYFCERTLDWKPESSAKASELTIFEQFRQHLEVRLRLISAEASVFRARVCAFQLFTEWRCRQQANSDGTELTSFVV
jgi:hypothetical protein